MPKPAIITHRYDCPSCGAGYGEPCHLNAFPQDYSHVSRHKIAQAALWAELREELPISTGWTVGRA